MGLYLNKAITIKRCSLEGAMTNLDSLLKSRDITLLTKVHIVKAMVFPVVMQGCESWTIKKAEHRRIDALELWCWRTLLRAPWTRVIKPVNPNGNQPWIFTGRTDAKAEAPILWPPDGKSWLTGKDRDVGKDWRQKEKRMKWLDSITDWIDMNLSKLWEIMEGREAWRATVYGVTKSQAWLGNWTITTMKTTTKNKC